MSIKIFYHYDVRMLEEKLANNIQNEMERTSGNIFYAPIVIIPNIRIKERLRLFLALRHEICINIEFSYIEMLFTKIFSDILGKNKEIKLIKPSQLKDVLVSYFLILERELVSLSIQEEKRLALKIAIDYLIDRRVKNKSFNVKKIFGLSDKLATFFINYALHYPDLCRVWLKGDNYIHHLEENFQRYIFKDILNQGYVEKSKEKFFILPFLYDYMKKKTGLSLSKNAEIYRKKNPNSAIFKPLHLFLLSNISPYYRKIIFEMSQFRDVYIYELNFFRGERLSEYNAFSNLNISSFRKNMLSFKNIKHRKSFVVHSTTVATDNFLQSFYLTQKIHDKTFYLPTVNKKTSFLSQLKDKILSQNPITESILNSFNTKSYNNTIKNDMKIDKSFQVFASPSIFREIETLYNSILYNLEYTYTIKDGTKRKLCLTDIAVYAPNIEKYYDAIKLFFNTSGTGKLSLKYNIHVKGGKSIWSMGVSALLNIFSSDLSRTNIFKLFYNTAFLNKFGLKLTDISTFIELCNTLHIYRAYDKIDKYRISDPFINSKSSIQYLMETGDDLHTWENGLKRLRISIVMHYNSNPLKGNFKNFNGIIPDFTVNDRELIDKFIEILELLNHTRSEILHYSFKRKSLNFWKEKISEIILEFLDPGDTVDKNEVNSFFASLDSLTSIDNLKILKEDSDIFNFNVFKNLIESILKEDEEYHGRLLTDGISFSNIGTSKSVPASIVYILGLNEGEFPKIEDTSALNLMPIIASKDKTSRFIEISERDRNAFLETLFSAQDKLYLSYICKDLEKDEERYPSSVLNELLRFINTSNIILENKDIYNGTLINFISGFPVIRLPINFFDIDLFQYNTIFKNVDFSFSDILFVRHGIIKFVNYINTEKDLIYLSQLDKTGDIFNKYRIYVEKRKPNIDNFFIKSNNHEFYYENPALIRDEFISQYLYIKSSSKIYKRNNILTTEYISDFSKLDISNLYKYLKDPFAEKLKRFVYSISRYVFDDIETESEPFFTLLRDDFEFTRRLEFILDTGASEKELAEYNEKLLDYYRMTGTTPSGIFYNIYKKYDIENFKELYKIVKIILNKRKDRNKYIFHNTISFGDTYRISDKGLKFPALEIALHLNSKVKFAISGSLSYVIENRVDNSLEIFPLYILKSRTFNPLRFILFFSAAYLNKNKGANNISLNEFTNKSIKIFMGIGENEEEIFLDLKSVRERLKELDFSEYDLMIFFSELIKDYLRKDLYKIKKNFFYKRKAIITVKDYNSYNKTNKIEILDFDSLLLDNKENFKKVIKEFYEDIDKGATPNRQAKYEIFLQTIEKFIKMRSSFDIDSYITEILDTWSESKRNYINSIKYNKEESTIYKKKFTDKILEKFYEIVEKKIPVDIFERNIKRYQYLSNFVSLKNKE